MTLELRFAGPVMGWRGPAPYHFVPVPDEECADLPRDPCFALHSATVDPVPGSEAQWPGEATIAGRAVTAGAVADMPEADLFRADIDEVVHTHLDEAATLLVVEWWTPRDGLRRVERA